MDINEKLAARRAELAIETEQEKKIVINANEKLAEHQYLEGMVKKFENARQFKKDAIIVDASKEHALGLKQIIMQDYLRYKNSELVGVIGKLKHTIQHREMCERKELSEVDIVNIIFKMSIDLRSHINKFEAAGQHDSANAMKLEMNVLDNYLSSAPSPELIKNTNDVSLGEVERSEKKNETLYKPQSAPVIPKTARYEMNPVWGILMMGIALFSGNIVWLFLGLGLAIFAVVWNISENKSN